MGGMKWTAEADQKLFLLVVNSIPNSAINYAAAAHMFTTGDTVCTEEAVKQHIKGLKRQFKNDPGLNHALTAAAEGKTPIPSPSRPRKTKAADKGADNDDDIESPTKKLKSERGKSVKVESKAPDTSFHHGKETLGSIDGYGLKMEDDY